MADDKKQKCFVIMPFTVRKEDLERYHGDRNHWKEVYQGLIMPAVEKAGLIPDRDDEDPSSRLITENIFRKLEEADVILCDLSAGNPNVYLELGWALRADKKYVLIKDDLTEFNFDLNQCSTCPYSHMLQPTEISTTIGKLSSALKATVKDQKRRYSIVHKLSLELGSIEAAKSGDIAAGMLGQILEEIRDLRGNVTPRHVRLSLPWIPDRVPGTADELADWLLGTAWRERDGDDIITFLHGMEFAHESPLRGASLGGWHTDDRSPKNVFFKWRDRSRSTMYSFDETYTMLVEAVPGGAVWELVSK